MDVANALERLGALIRDESIECRREARFIEKIAASKNRDQSVFCHEGGKRQKDKVTFGAFATPPLLWRFAMKMKIAITTRETVVVTIVLRESTGNG